MTVTITLEVDWNLDGTYTDESAQIKSIKQVDRGREHSITSLRYSHVLTGNMTVYMKNFDERYSENNTSSPLYGYLLPYRPIRLRVDNGNHSYYVFTGKITDIRPKTTKTKDKYAIIECVDGFDFLRNQNCDANTLQTDYNVSGAISDLLDQAGWDYNDTLGWTFPAQLGIDSLLGSSLIENNGDTIPYWWSDPDETILGAILSLADAFAGEPFIGVDGTFNYFARKLGGISSFTVTDDDITLDSELQKPWNDVRNKGRVWFYPYQQESSADIWKLVDVMEIRAGITKTIWAQFQYNNITPSPALSIVTPVATTDYTANSQADGGGTNKTAQLGVSMTAYATHSKLELTNNDANTIYITFFRLRGVLITARNSTYVEDIDSTSEGNYGTRTLTVEEKWVQTEDVAKNHAGYITTVFPNPRSILWLVFVNNFEKQFGVDLFDFIHCTIDEWDIDGQFVVTAIKHDLSPQEQRTIMRCEPALSDTLSYWYFPATFETNTYLGW